MLKRISYMTKNIDNSIPATATDTVNSLLGTTLEATFQYATTVAPIAVKNKGNKRKRIPL